MKGINEYNSIPINLAMFFYHRLSVYPIYYALQRDKSTRLPHVNQWSTQCDSMYLHLVDSSSSYNYIGHL